MRLKFAGKVGLCLVFLFGSALMSSAFAQAKTQKAEKAKPATSEKVSKIQGKVGRIDKETIVVLVRNSPKPVMINADTKFLAGHSNDHKPGSLSEVKQGNFIACAGSLDAKSQFMAKECLYRDRQ